MLYKSGKVIINFFDDYLLVTASKYKAFHGGSVKIKTLKEMLRRLPIALAQLKAGNASENMLNELK